MHTRSMTRVAAVVLLVAVGGLSAAAARGQPTGNTVTDWNAHAAPLSLAMVQGAVYDAVNAIDGGHQPYLVAPAADPSDSKEAAAATAAFRVLVGLFPTQQAALQPLYDASLAGVPDGPPKTGGIGVGEAAAAAMLAARANDGRVRGGLQRGEGARLADEYETDGGPDCSRDFLAGQRTRDLEPRLPRAGRERGAGHRRQRPPVGDDEPGCGRWFDRLLE